MLNLSGSELLFYGGLVIMAIAIIFTLLLIIISNFTGQKLQKALEQEYGKIKQ